MFMQEVWDNCSRYMRRVLSITIGLPYEYCSKPCIIDKNRAVLVQMLHSYIFVLVLALCSIMKNIVMNISLHRWPIRVLVMHAPICIWFHAYMNFNIITNFLLQCISIVYQTECSIREYQSDITQYLWIYTHLSCLW